MADEPLQAMVDELAALLTAQVKSLRVLEGVLHTQQRAVAARDVQGLLASLADQGRHLEEIRRMESDRRRVVAQLAAALGLEPRRTTLADLARALGGTRAADFEALALSGREAVAIVTRVNADNRRLLSHALEFVQSMLAALSGHAPAPAVYGASGNLTPRSQLDTLVDQTA